MVVLYGMLGRIGVRHSIRPSRSLHLSLTEIRTNIALATVMVAKKSSGVMLAMRFQAVRRRSVDGKMRSN